MLYVIGNWSRLYTSSSDGLSFNRISHHILGYDGPTVLVIKCQTAAPTQEPVIIGVYCHEHWVDSNRTHGSSFNFLFALSPELKLIKARDRSVGAFQWLNTRTYGLPHGLGFGGSSDKGEVESFRLWIPESLESCVLRTNCLTYEPGSLLAADTRLATRAPSIQDNPTTTSLYKETSSTSTTYSSSPNSQFFDIDCLEIWACGGNSLIEKGLSKQKEARDIQQQHIDKARKVDKAQFFSNPFDREMFLGNTVGQQYSEDR